VAREAGAWKGDHIPRLTDAIRTLVGERGITLTARGQRATGRPLRRAMMVDAPLLVLDDALASVQQQPPAANY